MIKSIELVKYCNDVYSKILELNQLGLVNQVQMDRVAEDLKNIKGIISQSALKEEYNVDMIQKDSFGYLPIKD